MYWTFGGIYTLLDITNKPSVLRKYKIQPGTNEPVDPKRLMQASTEFLFLRHVYFITSVMYIEIFTTNLSLSYSAFIFVTYFFAYLFHLSTLLPLCFPFFPVSPLHDNSSGISLNMSLQNSNKNIDCATDYVISAFPLSCAWSVRTSKLLCAHCFYNYRCQRICFIEQYIKAVQQLMSHVRH